MVVFPVRAHEGQDAALEREGAGGPGRRDAGLTGGRGGPQSTWRQAGRTR